MPGRNVYLRDVVDSANGIQDGSDIRTSFALVNGRRAVYMLVSKRADASTLAVVNRVKEAMPGMQASLPEEIKLHFQSPKEWSRKYLFENPALLDVKNADKKSFERMRSFFANDPWNLRAEKADFFAAIDAQIAERLKYQAA